MALPLGKSAGAASIIARTERHIMSPANLLDNDASRHLLLIFIGVAGEQGLDREDLGLGEAERFELGLDREKPDNRPPWQLMRNERFQATTLGRC